MKPGGLLWRLGVGGFALLAAVTAATGADLPARTTLSEPKARYSVPETGYAELRQGPLTVVVADNRAVNTATLPGHRPGYHGLASLQHAQQRRNLFVPAYAGLNFEHILDGTDQPRDVLFEPRRAPMELRLLDDHTAELYQAPTPHYGLESCHRYELLDGGVAEMTFECVPRRKTWKHDYLLLFWASYIDQPESLDIHFLGRAEDEPGAKAGWIRGVTPKHGQQATHRAANDARELLHVEPFPLELPFGFSRYRYAKPWYFGRCRGMAVALVFRASDFVRLTQSPSGGGTGCPAWDFQWAISQPEVGRRYQLRMRLVYAPEPAGGDEAAIRDHVRRLVQKHGPHDQAPMR
jgi:hypothetical protein